MGQARNQGREAPLEHFLTPLKKCDGYSLKLLDIVQKIWAPLKNSSPLLVSQADYGPAMGSYVGTSANEIENLFKHNDRTRR